MRKKSSTLDDLEGQYCNKNCIGCSATSLVTDGLFCLTVIQNKSKQIEFGLCKALSLVGMSVAHLRGAKGGSRTDDSRTKNSRTGTDDKRRKLHL